MDKIKIYKAISKDCDLKDERNARVRDSKFNTLRYYGGHIELIKDKIDTVKLQGVARPKNSCHVFTLQDLMNNGLEIYDSDIDKLIAEYECWTHLYNGARINEMVCKYSGCEAAIRGEAVIQSLDLFDGGSMSARHGQIDSAHVGRGGRLFVSERAVISRCEVVPTGLIGVGYRYGRAKSVPFIHHLKLCADSICNIKGDVAIGTLEVFCAAKIKRQFIANVCIGKLFENNHPVSDVQYWLHKHSVDAIA